MIEINEEHLGNSATEYDAMLLIDALNQRGWDVCYGPGAGWPDANSDERMMFERAWDECLTLLFA